jgi:hypothetical protein
MCGHWHRPFWDLLDTWYSSWLNLQRHSAIARNVYSLAVYERPNLSHERRIRSENLYNTNVRVVLRSNIRKTRTAVSCDILSRALILRKSHFNWNPQLIRVIKSFVPLWYTKYIVLLTLGFNQSPPFYWSLPLTKRQPQSDLRVLQNQILDHVIFR